MTNFEVIIRRVDNCFKSGFVKYSIRTFEFGYVCDFFRFLFLISSKSSFGWNDEHLFSFNVTFCVIIDFKFNKLFEDTFGRFLSLFDNNVSSDIYLILSQNK